MAVKKTDATNERGPIDSFRDLLACPECGMELSFAADDASCATHGRFPVRDRILSFLPDQSNQFDRHWEHAQAAQRPAAKIRVARQFLQPIFDEAGRSRHEFAVLDVGCGDGVHIQELMESREAFRLIGLDYSIRALMSAAQIEGGWLPVHADAQQLPCPDASFDAVISFGVLALLEDHRRGLREVVRVTRPGGIIGVWYAPRRRGVLGAMLSAARATVPRLPFWAQRAVADALVPFLGLMPTASTLSLRNGTWQECREVILVNLTPERVAYPTRQEIESELARLGCELIARPDAIDGEFWARKKPSEPGRDNGTRA